MIIDKSFFVGDILIQGLQPSKSGVANIISTAKSFDIDSYINTYEPKFLLGLLGKSLAVEFVTELKKDIHDAKWDNLKNKLIEVVGDYKTSPIAYYVYYWYMRSRLTDDTVEITAAGRVSNALKATIAFNNMVSRVREFKDWMDENIVTYYSGSYTISAELTNFINNLNI